MGSLVEEEKERKSVSRRLLLAKYFLHGIAYSFLLLILGLVWIFIMAFLTLTFSIVGLLLAFVLLFFIMGGLNTFLAETIWHVSMKENWKSILAHGLVLFITVLLVGMPSLIIGFAVPSWITSVALFIIYCFIDGFVAMRVAYIWERRTSYDGLSPYND
jgi:hypothetical protein